MSKSLRLVAIIPFDPYYQPFTIRTIMFCRHLVTRGHSVHLFYVPIRRRADTVRVHAPPLGPFRVSEISARALDSAVADCDLVHVQKSLPWVTPLALRLAKRHGKPVHYDWDDDDFSFYAENTVDAVRQLVKHGRGLTRLGKAMASTVVVGLLERLVPQIADTVGAASIALRAQCAEMGVPTHRLFAAPVGVDPDVFQPGMRDAGLRSKLGLDGPAVVYSGYFDLPEDLRWFVEMLAELRTIAPAVRTLVLGGGSGRSRLTEMIRQRGVSPSVVQTTGFVPFSDMPRWLASCEVAAIPLRDTRRNRSKSSLTAMECMACALPVVTHNVGDMPWIVGDTGIVVRDSSPAAFAESIARLASDADRRAALGSRARERARTRFRWELTVDEIEKAYRAGLASHSR